MHLMHPWLFQLLLTMALMVITYLATTPSEHPLVSGLHDKLQHLMAFFVLALLADRAFPASAWSWRKALPLLGYGLLLEIIQSFISYRFFSLADLAADALGLLLYTLQSALLATRLARKPDS
jgi:VanZ family protein